MTHDEVIENIGTIARSGTKRFMESMTGEQAKDANLIGQFGVGFYSAFMVSDSVTIRTRKAGEPIESGVEWQSNGDGAYTLTAVDKEENGTEIILALREGEDEFLEPFRLRHIINTYSDHIPLEIKMPVDQPEAPIQKVKMMIKKTTTLLTYQTGKLLTKVRLCGHVLKTK